MTSDKRKGFIKLYLTLICAASTINCYKISDVKTNTEEFNYLDDSKASAEGIDLDNDVNFKNYRVSRIYDPKEGFDSKVFGKQNRVLVSRLVPHGYKAPEYEYDNKFDSYYKPLFKVHTHTSLDSYEDDGDNSKVSRDNNDDLQLPFKAEIPSRQDDVNGNKKATSIDALMFLLKSLKNLIKSNSTRLKLSNMINLTKYLKPEQIKDVLKLIRKLKELFQNHSLYDAVKNLLRLLKQERHGNFTEDEEDIFHHLMENNWLTMDVPKKKREKVPAPFYTGWDFWTYHKPLYYDDCPPNQIKNHDSCIWTPPH